MAGRGRARATGDRCVSMSSRRTAASGAAAGGRRPPRERGSTRRARGTSGVRTVRARLGHGPRGLQRRRRRLGVLPARPRPLAGVPLERGRDGRLLRRVQRLCLGLALWNGRDPILKERMFGLTNSEGNHGEDVKEYWWYLDAVPSSAWLRWRYHYPQAAFPYDDLSRRTAAARKLEPEYELLDTGVFDDDRYWIVEVDYAKADPTDILDADHRRGTPGPDAATLHVLPTLWFRNDWSWDPAAAEPEPAAGRRRRHPRVAPDLGDYELAGRRRRRTAPARAAVLRERDQRAPDVRHANRPRRIPRTASTTTSSTARARSTPTRPGTKAAAWYRLDRRTRRVRRDPLAAAAARQRWTGEAGGRGDLLGRRSTTRCAARQAEADEFYAELTPAGCDRGRGAWSCARRSPGCSGASSSTPTTWPLARRRPGAAAAAARAADRPQRRLAPLRRGRHPVDARQVGIPLVRRLGPGLPLRHARPRRPGLREVPAPRAVPGVVPAPERALPAYEWYFDDVNPPVHALAALRGLANRRRRDTEFLERIFHKLLMNFTWWLNREDAEGNDLFSGGFLGLDNLERPRPVAPARGRPPRAVRRDGLDVRLLPLDAGDGDASWPQHDPAYARPRDDVPRARGPDRRGDQPDRPVGRGRTASTTTRCACRTGRRSRSRSIPWSGCCRCCRRSSCPSRRPSSAPRSASTSRASWQRSASPTNRSGCAARSSRAPGGDRLILSLLPPVRLERCSARPCPRTRSCRRTACGRSRGATSTQPFQIDVEGMTAIDRLRARRVDHRPVRRQLELARAGLVPGELPVHRVAAALGRGPRRGLHGRVPDRLRAPDAAPRRRPGPRAPAGLDLAARCRWPPAGRRQHREVPDRPRMARPAAVPRVLPRRHRRRHRRLAPDRLDRLVAHLLCRGGPLDDRPPRSPRSPSQSPRPWRPRHDGSTGRSGRLSPPPPRAQSPPARGPSGPASSLRR